MKSTIVKFLTARDEDDHLANRFRDYLTDSIIDDDLDMTVDEYLSLDIGDIEYQDDFLEDGVNTYHIYDVTVIGPDDVIDRLEDWNNLLKENLQ